MTALTYGGGESLLQIGGRTQSEAGTSWRIQCGHDPERCQERRTGRRERGKQKQQPRGQTIKVGEQPKQLDFIERSLWGKHNPTLKLESSWQRAVSKPCPVTGGDWGMLGEPGRQIHFDMFDIYIYIKHIKVDLSSRFSQHPPVPTCYRTWLAYSPLPGTLQLKGWVVLPPKASLYKIQLFWLLTHFYRLPSWLLFLLPPLPSPCPSLLTPLRIMSTLDSPRCPCL